MGVIHLNHFWIPMPDGARLGAKLWMPDDKESYSAILEYIPYRKDDYTVKRDSNTIAHFAKHGYACIRVDMRGSGSSDGFKDDEYTDQEIDDGVAVIDWIASQSWCNGRVGTMGISWGGIIGLQLAQRSPKALKTIITLGSTDQRYYDDAGYYMGCMVGQTLGWGSIMFGFNSRPPDPELVGDNWQKLWHERLEKTPHYLQRWLTHQHNDEYWLNNSVDINYSKIKIPVYVISGHADCWPNTVPRLLQNLNVPTLGLQGAWCHRYPHLGIPGPTVDFLSDAVRWFDHWLNEKETGMMDEAKYQIFLQDSVKPKTYYDNRPGRWIGLSSWPSEQVETKYFYLNQESLSVRKKPNQAMKILSPQTVGQFSGEYMPWFAFGVAEELPGNQNIEDSGSLVFDTETLELPLEIIGNAALTLHLSSDQPQGLVAARLCDLWPDGSSTLITRGILNLSQRNGKSNPEAMIPGEVEEVIVELNHVGYTVPKGHKLRLAVSTSYWPIAWPAPTNTSLTIYSELSLLKLPVLGKNVSTEVLKEFTNNNLPEEGSTITIREFNENRQSSFDEKRNLNVMEIKADNGKIRIKESGMEMASKSLHRFSISESNPLSACAEYEWEWEYGRGNWHTKTHTYTKITSDLNHFYLHAVLIAWEDNKQVFKKVWDEQFKRDHF